MDRQERDRLDGFGGRGTAPESGAFRGDPYGPRSLGATTDADAVTDDAVVFGRAPVQMQRGFDAADETTDIHAAAEQGVASGGGALPHGDRIQAAFGRHDVSHVQAHVGGAAADASAAIGATAYATGDRVAFASPPDLHTAAHEAAHVVQQRGGVQLKGGVGEADDAYERHADEVADAVVSGHSAEALLDDFGATGGAPGLQRRAITAGEVHNSEADGTDSIFDSKISTGKKFKVATAVDGADWTKVIAAYHAAIRPIGSAMAAHGFTDGKLTFVSNLPDISDAGKWGQKKAAFTRTMKAELKMPANITLQSHPNRDYWQALRDKVAADDRDGLRDEADIGLVDPFVVAVEVADRENADAPAWRVVTQFADSGCGYVKKVYNGAQGVGGGIATKERFDEKKGDAVGHSGTDYLYSSTHEQGPASFDSRIGAISGDAGKVGDNAPGLDAVTWLAAEGARFAPIAALGGAGSPESRFFIKPSAENWTGYKYLTASDLMRMWLTDFKKAYDIPADKVAEVVTAKGKTEDAPPRGAHYNLTLGARHDQG